MIARGCGMNSLKRYIRKEPAVKLNINDNNIISKVTTFLVPEFYRKEMGK